MTNFFPTFAQEQESLLSQSTQTTEAAKLVVYNDNHNTFEWVIESFVQVCHHSSSQAEQLSYIIHFNGKATVKSADADTLRPYKEALQERGLSAVIER